MLLTALRRYHLTLGCACHPEWPPLHRRARLGRIPGETDLMAARISREHRWHPTELVLRYDGHEQRFTFTPVWHVYADPEDA